jgi:hypothetical protein
MEVENEKNSFICGLGDFEVEGKTLQAVKDPAVLTASGTDPNVSV